MRGALAAAVVATASASGGCGGSCPPPMAPPAMTVNRARALVPGLEQGVAVSTAIDLGVCPTDAERPPRCQGEAPSCGVLRQPLRVWLVPVTGSLALDPGCPEGFSADTLTARATADASASSAGEWVQAVEPGQYWLAASRRGDRCAGCGALGDTSGCRVEVRPGRVAVREIVL